MPYKIKARVYALNRKIADLIPALKEHGITTTPQQLSDSLNGRLQSPKAQDILSYSNEIVNRWEKECK